MSERPDQSVDRYTQGIVVNHTCDAAIILENHRWFEAIARNAQYESAERIRYWSLDHELLLIGRVLVSVAQGASIVAALAERFRVSGAARIVRIATCGSLSERVEPGHVIVPHAAIRDEGTSAHYIPPEAPAIAHFRLAERCVAQLVSNGVPTELGLICTTDGRWKETDRKLSLYSRLGCLAVDMETAALYACGMDRCLPVASIMIVTDSPHKDINSESEFRGTADRTFWYDTVMPLFQRIFQITLEILR